MRTARYVAIAASPFVLAADASILLAEIPVAETAGSLQIGPRSTS